MQNFLACAEREKEETQGKVKAAQGKINFEVYFSPSIKMFHVNVYDICLQPCVIKRNWKINVLHLKQMSKYTLQNVVRPQFLPF